MGAWFTNLNWSGWLGVVEGQCETGWVREHSSSQELFKGFWSCPASVDQNGEGLGTCSSGERPKPSSAKREVKPDILEGTSPSALKHTQLADTTSNPTPAKAPVSKPYSVHVSEAVASDATAVVHHGAPSEASESKPAHVPQKAVAATALAAHAPVAEIVPATPSPGPAVRQVAKAAGAVPPATLLSKEVKDTVHVAPGQAACLYVWHALPQNQTAHVQPPLPIYSHESWAKSMGVCFSRFIFMYIYIYICVNTSLYRELSCIVYRS